MKQQSLACREYIKLQFTNHIWWVFRKKIYDCFWYACHTFALIQFNYRYDSNDSYEQNKLFVDKHVHFFFVQQSHKNFTKSNETGIDWLPIHLFVYLWCGDHILCLMNLNDSLKIWFKYDSIHSRLSTISVTIIA